MSDAPSLRMRKFSTPQSIAVLTALLQSGKRLDEESSVHDLYAVVQWGEEEARTEDECAKRMANMKRDWVCVQSIKHDPQQDNTRKKN